MKYKIGVEESGLLDKYGNLVLENPELQTQRFGLAQAGLLINTQKVRIQTATLIRAAWVLHPCADSINISKAWNMYFKDLLPRLVKAGDDGNYGSAVVCDTTSSRRIHYRKLVAEAKFQESSVAYEAAIKVQANLL
ncbi:unnamed protein product [Dovyalis caffra]|uniref:chorismate mutase n=1 Tax=Dovyalis caffra TaxID=77055 RepID=A0AAV1R0T9_9ROSI|nr:unnamed protein product [Dovyalis caffra]